MDLTFLFWRHLAQALPVPDSGDWLLRVIVPAAIAALGYMGRLLLKMPRPEYVTRLEGLLDKRDAELVEERQRAWQSQVELSTTQAEMADLRVENLQLKQRLRELRSPRS